MFYYSTTSTGKLNIDELLKEEIPAALLAASEGDAKPLRRLHIATTDSAYRKCGWTIPYEPYLKRYYVKTKHDGIFEMYAMTKIDIKRLLQKAVIEIVEAAPHRYAVRTKPYLVALEEQRRIKRRVALENNEKTEE